MDGCKIGFWWIGICQTLLVILWGNAIRFFWGSLPSPIHPNGGVSPRNFNIPKGYFEIESQIKYTEGGFYVSPLQKNFKGKDNMKKFQDIYESVLDLIEEGKNSNILATLKFTAARANFENLNKRTYPKSVLDKAVLDFNKEIKKSNVSGIVSNLDHSKEIFPSLSQASHLVSKLWMEGDLMKGEAKILNTSKGRDIMTVLKAGAKAGISIKGLGKIDKNGFIEDDGSYKLLSADIVNKPSFDKDVQISSANLFESANPQLKEEQKEIVSILEFNFLVERLIEEDFESLPESEKSQEKREELYDKNWDKCAEKVENSLKKVGKVVEEVKQKIKIEENFPISEAHFGMAKLSGYKGNLNEFMEIREKQNDPLLSQFREAQISGYEKDFETFKKENQK